MTPEGKFQKELVRDIKSMFPGCVILRNDPQYIQGIPDLIVVYYDRWAALETKAGSNAAKRPNQKYWIDKLDLMSFAAFVHPGNKGEVLNDLQLALKPRG